MTKQGMKIMAGLMVMAMFAGGCGDTGTNEHISEQSLTETSVADAEESVSPDEPETTPDEPETAPDDSETAPDESETALEKRSESDEFYILPITDEIFARIEGKSFKDDCTLPREELRYLHVLHRDLEGNVHEGEMIVNRHIAEDVLDILKQLYEADYPIEKIRLVDEYDAVDEASMEDNNSSSFNYRFVPYTTRVSKHGLGLAIDINPLYNPYTKVVDGEWITEPVTGEPYLDREADFPYKIDENDLCCKLFTEKGFEWGGAWKNSKDYQHFQVPEATIAEWYP